MYMYKALVYTLIDFFLTLSYHSDNFDSAVSFNCLPL